MKVIIIRSNPVDPDSRVEKIAKSLLNNGHQVGILAWDRSRKYKREDSNLTFEDNKAEITRFGIPASYGGGFKKNLIPLATFQLKTFLWLITNRNKYDVIHACDFDTAFISKKVAKLVRKKFVYDIFDYYVDAFRVPKIIKNLIEKEDHSIINSADAVIICTEKRIQQIKGTTPKNLTIIHNTPEDWQGRFKKLNLNIKKIKIVYVGILGEGRFIKELVNIVKKSEHLELHIGGFGYLEEFLNKVSVENDNIIFYGKLTYEKAIQLEESCDIMTAIYDPIVPNHKFAAPNKFYEALMLGKPVIMAKNTGMDLIVEENGIGEVIEFNAEELEIAINKIISRKNEWPAIKVKMNNLYLKNYEWKEMERRLLEMYDYL